MNAYRLRHDAVAATVLLAVALFELVLRESFYLVSSEVPRMLGVVVTWSALMAAAAAEWGYRFRHSLSSSRIATARVGPGLVGTAAAMWTLIVCGPFLPKSLFQLLGTEFALPLLALMLASAVTLVGILAPRPLWERVRRGACVGAALFVLTQPLLAAWRADDIVWPRQTELVVGDRPAPATQVLVLLDEWNDKAIGPIQAALALSGQPVVHRALIPAGDGTAKVLPSMFLRTSFLDAKPCGVDTVCSGSESLDFSRIQAGRRDIDVVGFYMPYCAIKGLRSCHTEVPASPVFSPERWRCALLRRSESLARAAGLAEQLSCAELNGRVWGDLAKKVQTRMWEAPLWRKGGVLYVHIPLPHPPSAEAGATLSNQYRANLDLAAQLIGQMAQALGRDTTRNFTLAVYSDHPLRTSMWCSSIQYKRADCALDPLLNDDRVPLLVTGDVPPAFDRMVSNQEVFDLLRSQ